MKFLITAINHRSFRVWEPMISLLVELGYEVATIWFPRLSDPDSKLLRNVRLPNILTHSIGREWLPTAAEFNQLKHDLSQAIESYGCDVILTCNPNLGPEGRLKSLLEDCLVRPAIIGLQHGYVQTWTSYVSKCEIDAFGTFGQAHLDIVGSLLPRTAVFALAMPSLDEFSGFPAPVGSGDMLYVAQQEPPSQIVAPFLHKLSERLQLEAVIRPHPEHREVYSDLIDKFKFSRETTFKDALSRASVIISTGSTSILEALAANRKIVVLPFQNGASYNEIPIVIDSMEVEKAIITLNDQDTEQFQRRRTDFLFRQTGSSNNNRAQIATERLLDALGTQFGFKALLQSKYKRHVQNQIKSPRRLDHPPDVKNTAINELTENRAMDAIAELKSRDLRIEDLQAEVEILRFRLRAQEEKNVDLRVANQTIEKNFNELLDLKREWYEPEISRLQSECSSKDSSTAKLQLEMRNLLNTKETWWEPEIARLTKDLDDLLAIKRDWYEPEILRLNSQMAEYEAKTSSIQEMTELVENLRNELSRSEEDKNAVALRLSEVNAELTVQNGKYDAQLSELQELTNLVEKLRSDLSKSEEDNKAVALKISEITAELSTQNREQAERHTAEMLKWSRELTAYKMERSEMENALKKYKTAFEHERRRIVGVGPQFGELRREIENAKAETRKVQSVCDELWEIKTNWWEPELERRAATINSQADQIEMMRQNKNYGSAMEPIIVKVAADNNNELQKRLAILENELASARVLLNARTLRIARFIGRVTGYSTLKNLRGKNTHQ